MKLPDAFYQAREHFQRTFRISWEEIPEYWRDKLVWQMSYNTHGDAMSSTGAEVHIGYRREDKVRSFACLGIPIEVNHNLPDGVIRLALCADYSMSVGEKV